MTRIVEHNAFMTGGDGGIDIYVGGASWEMRRIETRQDSFAVTTESRPATVSEREPGVPFAMLVETGICPAHALDELWSRPAGELPAMMTTRYHLYYRHRDQDERVLYLLAHPAVEQTHGPRDKVYQIQRFGKEFIRKRNDPLSTNLGMLLVPYRHQLVEVSVPLLIASGLTTLERVRAAAGFEI